MITGNLSNLSSCVNIPVSQEEQKRAFLMILKRYFGMFFIEICVIDVHPLVFGLGNKQNHLIHPSQIKAEEIRCVFDDI